MPQSTIDKIFRFYRSFQGHYGNEHEILYETEPFLNGVGGGGGGFLEYAVELAQKAQKEGYRIVIMEQPSIMSSRYPLHKEDEEKIKKLLGL